MTLRLTICAHVRLLFLAWLLLLQGCAFLTTQRQQCIESPVSIAEMNCWSIQGKLGYRTLGSPQQRNSAAEKSAQHHSGSAYLSWQQDKEQYKINLSGPLGSGAVDISGTPSSIRLHRAGEDIQTSSNPAGLFYEQLGWELPIQELFYWIKGQPSPISPYQQLTLNEKGQVKTFDQVNWGLTYSRYTPEGLPAKIIAQNQHIRLTFIIKRWQSNLTTTK